MDEWMLWVRLICLRTGNSGGLLFATAMNLRFSKHAVNIFRNVQPLASQENLAHEVSVLLHLIAVKVTGSQLF
jgi:hypothetical protein